MPKSRRSSGVNVSFFAFQDIITAVTGILILIVILLVLMLRQPGAVDVPVDEVEKHTLAELEQLIKKALAEIKKFATVNFATGDESETAVREEIELLRRELEKEEDPERLALRNDLEKAEMERDQVKEKAEALLLAKAEAEEQVEQLDTELVERKEFVRENAEEDQVWIQFTESEKEPVVIELTGGGAVLRSLKDPEFRKSLPSANLAREIGKMTETLDSLESYFVFFIRPSGIAELQPLKEILVQKGFDLGYRPLGEEEQLKILGPETLNFDK